MAKFTKRAIMLCFLDLLERKQIDKITVKDICEECEINRNTFYYYYSDIYNVLAEVFEYEKEKGLKELENDATFYDEYRKCAMVLMKNKKAVMHIYRSKMRHVLLEYLGSVTENYVRYFVAERAKDEKLTQFDIQYITKFYSYSIIGYTMKWIEDGLVEYRDELVKRIANTFDDTIDAMIQSCKKQNQTK